MTAITNGIALAHELAVKVGAPLPDDAEADTTDDTDDEGERIESVDPLQARMDALFGIREG